MHNLEEPLELPSNILSLDDLATEIWNSYFRPPEPLNLADRRELMKRYNSVAKKRNEMTGTKVLIFLTPSTRIEFIEEIKTLRPPGVGSPSRCRTTEEYPIPENVPRPQGGNIIQQIIAHYLSGKANKEIIALGFNKSTVARQVGEYKKRQQLNHG